MANGLCVIVLLGTLPIFADDVLKDFSVDQLVQQGAIQNGAITAIGERQALAVSNREAGETRVPIASLKNLGTLRHPYAVEGLVAADELSPSAVLEMWSVFPDGAQYFTRTLGERGPMGILKGSFDWRVFHLPFFKDETQVDPVELLLNVVFQGPGTVYLADLKLVHYEPGKTHTAIPGAWWSPRTGAWIGTIGGSLLGALGALLGVLGRRRRIRVWLGRFFGLMAAAGVAIVVLGGVALAVRQPFEVTFVLLLGGGLMVVLGASLAWTVRRWNLNEEMRRMAAMDARP